MNNILSLIDMGCHDTQAGVYISQKKMSLAFWNLSYKSWYITTLCILCIAYVSTETPEMRSRVVWWRWMFIDEQAQTRNARCKASYNGEHTIIKLQK